MCAAVVCVLTTATGAASEGKVEGGGAYVFLYACKAAKLPCLRDMHELNTVNANVTLGPLICGDVYHFCASLCQIFEHNRHMVACRDLTISFLLCESD